METANKETANMETANMKMANIASHPSTHQNHQLLTAQRKRQSKTKT